MTYQNIVTKTASIALLSISTVPAYAHVTSATGGSSSGPIIVDSPLTLAKGDAAISLSYERVDLESFSDEFLEEVALAGFEEVHNTDSIQIPSLSVAYGITDRLELSAIIPLIFRRGIAEGELESPTEAEVEVLGNSAGFGDIVVGAKYQFSTQEHNFVDLAVRGGLSIPTGGTNELEDDGSRFEVEFQPGSGSVDYIFGASVGKTFGKLALNADVNYRLVSEGSQDTDLGDSFSAGAAVSYGWDIGENSNFNITGEVLYIDQQRERIGDEFDENSGGNHGVFGSIAIPLSERLNGIQNDSDYRLIVGISAAL